MLFDMYDAGVAKEKHIEFHKTSPLMPVAIGMLSAHSDCFSRGFALRMASQTLIQEGNTWKGSPSGYLIT